MSERDVVDEARGTDPAAGAQRVVVGAGWASYAGLSVPDGLAGGAGCALVGGRVQEGSGRGAAAHLGHRVEDGRGIAGCALSDCCVEGSGVAVAGGGGCVEGEAGGTAYAGAGGSVVVEERRAALAGACGQVPVLGSIAGDAGVGDFAEVRGRGGAVAVEAHLRHNEALGADLALLGGGVPGSRSHTVDTIAQVVEVGGG